jgi:hypothetical protein
VILTILYLAGAKNTDSWCARKGDLKRATPLDVLMVPSSSIAIVADGKCLACGGFSLGEPVHLVNFEFITDYFDDLSLSPRWGNEGTIFVGSTRNGSSTPQWAKELAPPVHRGEARLGPLEPNPRAHRLRSPPTGWTGCTINWWKSTPSPLHN